MGERQLEDEIVALVNAAEGPIIGRPEHAATMRERALQKLSSELARLEGGLDEGKITKLAAAQTLERWLTRRALALARDESVSYPEAERSRWNELWDDIRGLLADLEP